VASWPTFAFSIGSQTVPWAIVPGRISNTRLFETPEIAIHQLVDIASKNGNLLLNIGPRPDGTIPDQVQQTLRDIGAWFKANGEATYGTPPRMLYGEGPRKVVGGAFQQNVTQPFTAQDIRFTAKANPLHAIALGWPRGGHLTIHSLGANSKRKVRDGSLLGSDDRIGWLQGADGLELVLPAQALAAYAYRFRITPDEH